MQKVFGDFVTETPYKSGFDYGDRNIYCSYNRARVDTFPITAHHSFENKVKATPTTFFAKVPTTEKVFAFPKNDDPFRSDRLVGSAVLLDINQFDRMNARLGPTKRVDVVFVGMGNRPSMAGHWQEAAWVEGRRTV